MKILLFFTYNTLFTISYSTLSTQTIAFSKHYNKFLQLTIYLFYFITKIPQINY